MADQLSVIASGRVMGYAKRDGNDLSFSYRNEWLEWEGAFPLSLSMPLRTQEHPNNALEFFLWGLLPDNSHILEQWGKRFQVSPRNPFRMIEHVGEDCAGAIQFVSEDREDELTSPNSTLNVSWLTETEIEKRIELLLKNHSITRTADDEGQFSLAGAQPKTAFYYDREKKRWGIPRGHTPTTHILKPALGHFEGHAENENFCLLLAAELGLHVASAKVIHFGAHPVIVVERYDRRFFNSSLLRIHQEDFCQALGIHPAKKYQSDGGPTPRMMAELLAEFSSDSLTDRLRLADAFILNWLIKGTDAHAKNYSLLLAAESQVRLAPLYDIASALPYPHQVNPHKARLAMKVGSEYLIKKIERRHWEACGKDLGLKGRAIFDRIESMAERMPNALETVHARMTSQGITHPVIDDLVEAITKNCGRCMERIAHS